MKGDVVISWGKRCSKEKEWWVWGIKMEVDVGWWEWGGHLYNRVMMSKMEMPFQKKENDKHKEEDDDVPEEINEEIHKDILKWIVV